MFTRNAWIGLAALSLVLTPALVGCAADTADLADEDVEEAEGELSKAGKALIGSYKDDSGAFKGLILTSVKAGQRNEFVADVDTGIRCIMAPCPSSERIEGTFTAGTKTITLRSTTASQHVQHLLGKYSYVVQGDKLSLYRKGFAQSLEKVHSYCAEPTDCDLQNLIHPMCVGHWTCSTSNTCGWKCGVPVPVDPCEGLDLAACTANPECKPKFGPSVCSPNGICTADMAYKGCEKKPAEEVCLSSASCAPGQHCSTEDGVCNPYGMLAVCAGTCVE